MALRRITLALNITLAVLVVVLSIAVAFLVYRDRAASSQAHATCERSRIFGPPLADAYERYRILSPAELAAYRAGLPKKC